MSEREQLAELRRRVIDEAGLGRPTPLVSPAIAVLLCELLSELERLVDEKERSTRRLTRALELLAHLSDVDEG